VDGKTDEDPRGRSGHDAVSVDVPEDVAAWKNYCKNRAAGGDSAGVLSEDMCMMELDVIAAKSSGFGHSALRVLVVGKECQLGINEIDDEMTVVELLLTSLTLMVFRFEAVLEVPSPEMEIVRW